VDGSSRHQLNPSDTVPGDLGDFWNDFDGRPGISEAWSPDEAMIAFTAFVKSADSTALYLVNPDGSDLRQIVPTTVGATSAQWSPDGSLIAFTSRLRSQPQVWVVRPDGSELAQLTDGADGSTSIMPVWSPDGTKLLFQRKLDEQLTLWTMNRDGSGQRQLSPRPLGSDYFGGGGYAWWPAATK
jgi:Tol biopolymer transport system component